MDIDHKCQKLFVFGCSLTKDNYIDTWADILSRLLRMTLVNGAERGAGYDYIVQKVFTTDISHSDKVVIMWPSADRYDLYVNSATPHLQTDVKFASWPDGKAPAFVDYNGQYNTSNGWYINGAVPRGYKNQYYKYFYNQVTHVNRAWASIVAVQKYLEAKQIEYVMCNSYPLLHLIQYHDDGVVDFNYKLYQQIDLDKFVRDADEHGFIELVKSMGFDFFNPHHPNVDGHRWYVENYLIPKIV